MTCDGCANAISRILGKIPGVTSYDTNVSQQKVIVKGTADKDVITEKLSKWATASKKELTFVGET